MGYSPWDRTELDMIEQLSIAQVGMCSKEELCCVHAKSLQSCPELCNPMNYSPPGSSVYGILQARILEWVAMPSSRGSSPPRDQT